MSENPTVSVVVRTFNRPVLLDRALTCLARQTWTGAEVIVVNDAGVDVSTVVDRYREAMPITMLVLPDHRGPGGAANAGLQAASGQWALLFDDDDTLDAGHLADLVTVAAASPGAVAVASESVLVTENANGTVAGADLIPLDPARLLVENQLCSNAVLFDRALALSLGGMRTDIHAYEDWELWLRLLEAGTFVTSPTVGARHHHNPGVRRRRMLAGPHIVDDIRKVYAEHPVDAPELDDQRTWLLTEVLLSGRSQPIYGHSYIVAGDGDVSALITTLDSIMHTAAGQSHEVLIAERSSAGANPGLDSDTVVFGDGSVERARWLAAGRHVQVIPAGHRLEPDPDAVTMPANSIEMHERTVSRSCATSVVPADPPTTSMNVLQLDYPLHSQPRYGYGRPPHQRIHDRLAAGRDGYRELLEQFVTYGDELVQVPAEPGPDLRQPYWNNDFFKGHDALCLYGMLRTTKPERYLEIGSGISTRWARQAIIDGSLSTRITSIDPFPRAHADQICDEVIRRPLEEVGTECFRALGDGDILFFDGSHRCLTNSDVSVFFMEVLPELPRGVLVQVHDIFWPWDYPPQWAERGYSEQYLLGMKLMENPATIEPVLPMAYVSRDPELSSITLPLWKRPELSTVRASWVSFWFRVL